MKILAFSNRNIKELLRDPLMMFFSAGFPIVLLLLLSAIQANIPVELFGIDSLAPGITVFGLSFISLFSGTLIAKDRTTSFLMRLFAAPLTSSDFIAGYMLPMLPIALGQTILCYAVALCLGMAFSVNILLAIVVVIPVALLFIGIGLLMGSLLNDKAVGGISSIITNLAAWMSGIWFDLDLVGGVFRKISYLLPFAHAVDAAKAAVAGNYAEILPHLWWVIGYAGLILALAISVFKRKMSSDRI
ncbi:MAG: ABC transporter permease [Clostridia bacterium]|jgi:ABC-2 type transport system permease protein